jgi:uncharacterized protein YjbJ (UPF0337 family)
MVGRVFEVRMVQANNRNLEWRNLQNMVRIRWSKLSEDDLASINGREEYLVATLRKRYGYGKAQAEIEINQWLQDVYTHGENL